MYFGAPSNVKFYKGSAQDSAWNHDLLWKMRVEEEDRLIPMEEEAVHWSHLPPKGNKSREQGIADRTWTNAEKSMLKSAILKHGAHFSSIINDKHYTPLGSHSADAMQHQWRTMEGHRVRSKDNIRSQFLRLAKIQAQEHAAGPGPGARAANPFFTADGAQRPGDRQTGMPVGFAAERRGGGIGGGRRVSTAPSPDKQQGGLRPSRTRSGKRQLPSLRMPGSGGSRRRRGPGGQGSPGTAGPESGGAAARASRRMLLERLKGLEESVGNESRRSLDIMNTVRSLQDSQQAKQKNSNKVTQQLQMARRKNSEYRSMLRSMTDLMPGPTNGSVTLVKSPLKGSRSKVRRDVQQRGSGGRSTYHDTSDSMQPAVFRLHVDNERRY